MQLESLNVNSPAKMEVEVKYHSSLDTLLPTYAQIAIL